jgi:hypothetical protein
MDMSYSQTKEYRKAYYAAHRDYLLAEYQNKKRYTHEGYTHDCGYHCNSASEAVVHLLTPCESLVYQILHK